MEYKQVIAVRKDLKMGKGKTCAQVAHASLAAAEIAMREFREYYEAWKSSGEKKVVVAAEDEKHLGMLFEEAKKLKLPSFIVRDAGLTQLPPGTATAVAIGPAPEEKVDKITGNLKLL